MNNIKQLFEIENRYSEDYPDVIIEDYKLKNNKIAQVSYSDSTDEVYIIIWNEFFGDIEAAYVTNKFDSFYDTHQEHREQYEDNWDYATESVYQTYSQMDWDLFLSEYAQEYLAEYIEDQIKKHKPKFIQRPLIDRIKRYIEELKFNLKPKKR